MDHPVQTVLVNFRSYSSTGAYNFLTRVGLKIRPIVNALGFSTLHMPKTPSKNCELKRESLMGPYRLFIAIYNCISNTVFESPFSWLDCYVKLIYGRVHFIRHFSYERDFHVIRNYPYKTFVDPLNLSQIFRNHDYNTPFKPSHFSESYL